MERIHGDRVRYRALNQIREITFVSIGSSPDVMVGMELLDRVGLVVIHEDISRHPHFNHIGNRPIHPICAIDARLRRTHTNANAAQKQDSSYPTTRAHGPEIHIRYL
jgi:hypothetical protein